MLQQQPDAVLFNMAQAAHLASVVQALNAWGLPCRAQLAPGVALCRLHCDAPSLDGLDIMLKGGQMDTKTLFEDLLDGTA